jgi:hypothetical protein
MKTTSLHAGIEHDSCHFVCSVGLTLLVAFASSFAQAADGFFQVKEIDHKWILLDPDGKPFLMRGVNHFGDGTHMPWNQKDRHGSAEAWRGDVAKRHLDWGFNYLPPSIGPSHIDPATLSGTKSRDKLVTRTDEWKPDWYVATQMPFTIFLEVPKQYMSPPNMGDVFGMEFIAAVEAKCANVCGQLKDNKQLIGYHFCHNPPWNIAAPSAEPWIADCTRPGSAGLKQWVQLMRRVYGSIDRWRETYGVPIQEWSDIEKLEQPLNGYVSKSRALEDKEAFLQLICDQWHRVYHDAIRRHDPNHLILGDRNTLHLQPSPSPWAYQIMKRYLAVLSINVMGTRRMIEMRLETATRHWDGPILLADTGVGIYEGEPAKTGYQAADFAEYERCYIDLVTLGVEHPQIIGFGWCGWFETPHPGGRSGLVEVRNDAPLLDRVEIAKKWNAWGASEFAKASRGESKK